MNKRIQPGAKLQQARLIGASDAVNTRRELQLLRSSVGDCTDVRAPSLRDTSHQVRHRRSKMEPAAYRGGGHPARVISDESIGNVLDLLEEMHPEAMCALEHHNPFELIVAVTLSAQTTDVSVNRVTPVLFEKYPDPESLSAADPEDVMEIIHTIGLYRNKSKNIIRLAYKLVNEYGSEVPCDFDSLVSLPGVGRKTANVVLAEGFGVPRIAVDTHVFRVANRIGLTDEQDVNSTEDALMDRLPEENWIRAHHLLIFHGRKICHARKPDCGSCAINGVCLHYMNQ